MSLPLHYQRSKYVRLSRDGTQLDPLDSL